MKTREEGWEIKWYSITTMTCNASQSYTLLKSKQGTCYILSQLKENCCYHSVTHCPPQHAGGRGGERGGTEGGHLLQLGGQVELALVRRTLHRLLASNTAEDRESRSRVLPTQPRTGSAGVEWVQHEQITATTRELTVASSSASQSV